MRNHYFLLLWLTAPLAAQPALTLREAVQIALAKHPSVEASIAQRKAAATRVEQARTGYLPKVNYSESFQTSNNPVFVFGTLLTQRRFTERNFAIDSLNRPDFIRNFQSQLGVEQLAYDFGGVKSRVRSAELGQQVSGEHERLARMNVIAQVVRSYHGVVLGEESLKVAHQAVASAEADLQRAEAVRAAGMSTDADVLSIRVQLAAMREQEIERAAQLEVARAALNEALGLPLDTAHTLTTPLAAVAVAWPDREALEKQARAERPETKQAQLARQLAEAQSEGARSMLYPRVTANAAFEADRARFVNQGGTNWYFAASLRWNLFGGPERGHVAEAGHALAEARAREREAGAGVQLQVRQAHAALTSASQRIEVATAAVAQAEESLRITKNRYAAGLSTVTDLLRTETAVLEASTRKLAAIYDQRVAATTLELAAGTLSGDSDVLQ